MSTGRNAVLKGIDAFQFEPALGRAWLVAAVAVAVHERAGCVVLATLTMGVPR